MTTNLNLDPATVRSLEVFIDSGRFASLEEAVSEGVRLIEQADVRGELVDLEDLSVEERAGVERGLADVAAGRVHSSDEVFAYLEKRHAAGL